MQRNNEKRNEKETFVVYMQKLSFYSYAKRLIDEWIDWLVASPLDWCDWDTSG